MLTNREVLRNLNLHKINLIGKHFCDTNLRTYTAKISLKNELIARIQSDYAVFMFNGTVYYVDKVNIINNYAELDLLPCSPAAELQELEKENA